VTVLSYDLWQTRFGGRAGIVGLSVRINGYPFTVVGVAPRGFQGTFAGVKSELWVPLAMSQQVFTGLGDIRNRDTRLLMGIGRLRPGVSLEQARGNLNGLAGQLAREFPNTNRDRGVSIVRLSALHPALTRAVSRFFGALMGVTAMTLLIACTNLANLRLSFKDSAKGGGSDWTFRIQLAAEERKGSGDPKAG
jgi:putative ABC transport system permease protein